MCPSNKMNLKIKNVIFFLLQFFFFFWIYIKNRNLQKLPSGLNIFSGFCSSPQN